MSNINSRSKADVLWRHMLSRARLLLKEKPCFNSQKQKQPYRILDVSDSKIVIKRNTKNGQGSKRVPTRVPITPQRLKKALTKMEGEEKEKKKVALKRRGLSYNVAVETTLVLLLEPFLRWVDNNDKIQIDWQELAKIENESKAPVTPQATDIAEPPPMIAATIYRKLRDTKLAREIKVLHNYVCQICPGVFTIELPDGGRYAEAHHIKPLSREHHGLDIRENILCLCPNCHAKLDYGVIEIDRSDLKEVDGHVVSEEFVDYHNQNRYAWQN